MLEFGSRDSAGTKVAAPSAAPNNTRSRDRGHSRKRTGPAQRLLQRVHRQRADDTEGALREIDHAGDAINQRKAQCDDGKDTALEQTADNDRGHFACSLRLTRENARNYWSGIPVGLLTNSHV